MKVQYSEAHQQNNIDLMASIMTDLEQAVLQLQALKIERTEELKKYYLTETQ